jgi:hypothetical protein
VLGVHQGTNERGGGGGRERDGERQEYDREHVATLGGHNKAFGFGSSGCITPGMDAGREQ